MWGELTLRALPAHTTMVNPSKASLPHVQHLSDNNLYSDTSSAFTIVPYKHTPFCLHNGHRHVSTHSHHAHNAYTDTRVRTSGDLSNVTVSSKCMYTRPATPSLVSSPQLVQVLCTLLAQFARPPRTTNLVSLLE